MSLVYNSTCFYQVVTRTNPGNAVIVVAEYRTFYKAQRHLERLQWKHPSRKFELVKNWVRASR